MNDSVEFYIDQWQPDREDLTSTLDGMLVSCESVIGTWTVSCYFDGGEIRICDSAQGLVFQLMTVGCLKEWTLTRRATYGNGVLVLDRAVQEYCPMTYDRMYSIRLNGDDFLVSQASVRQAIRDSSTDIDWAHHASGFAFRRETHDEPLVFEPLDNSNKTEQ